MEHLTPAQQHWQKVMAARRGDDESTLSAIDITAYEQMLHRLRADKSQLSRIQGNERKAEYKREVLPNYRAWIDGVLESQTGIADEVFVNIMIWNIDTHFYADALKMAEYAIKFNLPLPDNYNRTLATVLVDEICDRSLAVKASGREGEVMASLETLFELERITAESDMPDGARAKLYKVIGLTLKDDDKQQEQALDYLQRAILADDGVGVKKEIEQLLRALAKKNNDKLAEQAKAAGVTANVEPKVKKATTAEKKKTTTSNKKVVKS
ncbi:phage terminase small subunit [Providencia stuartii]|uniref:phage terminase small subunit n=1 Tax=Providencia stuartii TaxID=588 RepID=UPI0015D60228|nr:phage terminase small subunit [Providencia stuartii]